MLNELLNRYPCLKPLKDKLIKAADMIYSTYQKGGKVLCCGNGGSCADCDHIVGELMKGFLLRRPLSDDETNAFCGLCENPEEFAKCIQGAIPAISLPSQGAVMSAYINDVEADMVYAQLAYGYGNKDDVLIALSTSGNSKNVVNAVIAAKAKGTKTIALTGNKESRLMELCDVTINAPETETFKVQELHLPVYHYLCAEVEKRVFEK